MNADKASMQFRLFLQLQALSQFCSCLKLRERPVCPLVIFQRFCIGRTLPWLLHSLKDCSSLSQLVGHSGLPFDHFYNTACRLHITKERLDTLLSWVKKNPLIRENIIPRNCLLDIGEELSLEAWETIGYFYPISSFRMDELPFQYWGKFLAALPKGSADSIRLVQGCKWISTPQEPEDSVFESSFAEQLGRKDAWTLLHYSCFAPKPKQSLVNNRDRITRAAHWLASEISLRDLTRRTSGHNARWVVHLILVLRQLEGLYHYTGEPAGKPIYDYLKAIGDVESPFLSKFILLGTRFYLSPHAIRPKYRDFMQVPLPPFTKVLEKVLDGLETAGEKAQWFLATAELYYLHNTENSTVFHDADIIEELLSAFEVATALEQVHWMEIYFKNPEILSFMPIHIYSTIQASKELQGWFLTTLDKYSSEVRIDMVKAAVAPNALLKEARFRLVKDMEYTVILKEAAMETYDIDSDFEDGPEYVDLLDFCPRFVYQNLPIFTSVGHNDFEEFNDLPDIYPVVLATTELLEISLPVEIPRVIMRDWADQAISWLTNDIKLDEY